jgi:hypothetical protein
LNLLLRSPAVAARCASNQHQATTRLADASRFFAGYSSPQVLVPQPEQTRRFYSIVDRHRFDRRWNLNHLAADRFGIGSLLLETAAAAMLWSFLQNLITVLSRPRVGPEPG